MDPFIYDEGIYEGGDLYINLGDISEDILKDSRKFFEQGLPGPNEPFDVDSTVWGYIPRKQSLVNAFSNDPATRLMQDVGLNGMSSERERDFRSEERRVGKECRSRWSPNNYKKKGEEHR